MSSTSEQEYITRIRALEKQCAVLAAEVDRQRPVVAAACRWNAIDYRDEELAEAALDVLSDACDDYEAGLPR